MAKLKFNEFEIQASPLEESHLNNKEAAFLEIKKELKIDKLSQSVSSLANGVSSLNQHLISKEKQLATRISEVEDNVKQLTGLDEEQLESLHADLRLTEENLQNLCINLAQRIQSVEVKLKETPEPQKVLQPKVEQITVHKDHHLELNELRELNKKLELKTVELEAKTEALKSAKVIKLERHDSKSQKYINLALGVGLLLSLLANFL